MKKSPDKRLDRQLLLKSINHDARSSCSIVYWMLVSNPFLTTSLHVDLHASSLDFIGSSIAVGEDVSAT